MPATATKPTGLRVVVVGLNYAPETTGIAPYTTGLARHLALRGGHDVAVVTGHPHYPEWRLHPGYETPHQPVRDHGVRLLRVPHPVPRNPGGPSRVLMELVFALRAGARLSRERPDVVVVVSPALLSLAPALALRRLKRYAVGVVVQDIYGAALAETGLTGGLLARLSAWLERFLLRRADSLVVIHEVFRQRLQAAGIPDEKLVVIPNWSHVSTPVLLERDKARQELGWAPDDFVALHAGNMGAKQGLEGLIAVGRLAQERASSVRIVLLGNGSQRNELTKLAEGASQVTILDSLPQGQFEAALAAADCLLLHEKPGVLEMSVPSKLTTYFSAGRPVVAATDERSGASSLMTAARAGVCVRAGDPARILDAIEKVAGDPLAAQRMGTDARAFAAEHLAGAAALARFDAWIESLTSGTRDSVPAAGRPVSIRRRRWTVARGDQTRRRA